MLRSRNGVNNRTSLNTIVLELQFGKAMARKWGEEP
jgi:hypothetical protein